MHVYIFSCVYTYTNIFICIYIQIQTCTGEASTYIWEETPSIIDIEIPLPLSGENKEYNKQDLIIVIESSRISVSLSTGKKLLDVFLCFLMFCLWFSDLFL